MKSLLPILALGALLAGCAGESGGGSGGLGGGGGAPTGFIAYTLGSSPTTQDVFVQNVSTGVFTAQSPTVSGIQPALSRGGSKVVFVSTTEADRELYVQTVNQNSTLQRLTNNDLDDQEPTFHPTSGEIYFVRKESATVSNIWRVNQTGTIQLKVTDFNSVKKSPALSPDGTKLAFWEFTGTTHRLRVRILATGVESTVISGFLPSDPDPSTTWYDNDRLVASALWSGVQKIFSLKTDGSGVIQLTEGFRPRRSNNGGRILFGRLVGGGIQAFTIEASGGSATQYTVAGSNVSDSWDWSQD